MASRAAASSQSLLGSLSGRARSPGVAFTYVDFDSDRQGVRHALTHAELYSRVIALAARLRGLASPGERVAIVCPHDLTYPVAFLAAMAAGTIAVPLFAPEVGSHARRVAGALADCGATVWLTAAGTLGSVEHLQQASGGNAQVVVVDRDHPAPERFELPEIDPTAPAYLQYTSGSTRTPAGAIITHEAIAANLGQAAAAFALDRDTTCVGWLPFFHDMGLLLLLCMPVALGCESVFSAPFAFVLRPMRWLSEIAAHPNVVTAAPNFAYNYASERVTEQQRETLDLSNVKVAINGAEPVRARTIERFQELFGPQGFAATAMRPSYGLAEATLFVSTTRASAPPTITEFDRAALAGGRAIPPTGEGEGEAIRLVSAGVPVGQHVAIADPATATLLPDGKLGEVWINGPNLARGYWDQRGPGADEFDCRLLGAGDALPSGGWLRTGDQGTFHGGELYITGRLKDLIIIDGTNHYPHDLEETASAAHPAIRSGRVAAFGIATEAGEEIVVVLERARTEGSARVPATEISRAVKQAISAVHDLMVKDVQVLAGAKVLMTSSGKVARSANRDRYLARATE